MCVTGKVSDINTDSQQEETPDKQAILTESEKLSELAKARHQHFKSSLRIDIFKLPINRNERRSGFGCPPSCQQVATWINTATTVWCTVMWLFVPIFTKVIDEGETFAFVHGSIAALIALTFLLSCLNTIRLAYICTKCVPTDILVQK